MYVIKNTRNKETLHLEMITLRWDDDDDDDDDDHHHHHDDDDDNDYVMASVRSRLPRTKPRI